MADQKATYRFSIRDLLLVTAGMALLLMIYKREGLYLAGSLMLTLIAGGLFLKLLSVRPLHQWKAPFVTCTLLNVGVIGLYFVIGAIRGSYRVPISNSLNFGLQPVYFLEGREEIFSLLFALGWLISLAGFIACYAWLIWHTIRPIFSALLLLMNLGLAALIVQELLLDIHTSFNRVATLRGYFIALTILAAPWFLKRLSRWLDSLPTTREEIEEPPGEEAINPDE